MQIHFFVTKRYSANSNLQNIHHEFSFRTALESVRQMKERLLHCLVHYKTSLKGTIHCYKAEVCCVSTRADSEQCTLRLQGPYGDPQEQHSSEMGPFNPCVLRSHGPALRFSARKNTLLGSFPVPFSATQLWTKFNSCGMVAFPSHYLQSQAMDKTWGPCVGKSQERIKILLKN